MRSSAISTPSFWSKRSTPPREPARRCSRCNSTGKRKGERRSSPWPWPIAWFDAAICARRCSSTLVCSTRSFSIFAAGGKIALDAAALARRLGDLDRAQQLLTIATDYDETRADAERRLEDWFSGEPAELADEQHIRMSEPFDLRWSAADALAEPSRTKTDIPAAEDSNPPISGGAISEKPVSSEPTTISVEQSEPPISEAPLSDSIVPPRVPSIPELATPKEEELFEQLIQGSYDAGESLVAMYGADRAHDVLTVRRYQATLRRGDRVSLSHLRDAAIADDSAAFARAVEHVLVAFDDSAPAIEPPELSALPAQPDATKKLLLSWLDGTVNEALALVCECGMIRRELADYHLSGTDRVPPVATTAVGRVYAALTRLFDLGNRLFYRSRSDGDLRSTVALVQPLGAILSGKIDEGSPALTYELGSALAAATPPLALAEALDDGELENIIGALLAGFGPVDRTSVTREHGGADAHGGRSVAHGAGRGRPQASRDLQEHPRDHHGAGADQRTRHATPRRSARLRRPPHRDAANGARARLATAARSSRRRLARALSARGHGRSLRPRHPA